MDTNPLSLRWAVAASRGAALQVPLRRTARDYDVVTLNVPDASPGSVRWLCAESVAPPLAAEAFDVALVVNLLDAVPDPYTVLGQASALVREGGYLVLAQPDAWTADVTPPQGWLAVDDAGWDAALQRFGLQTVQKLDDIHWTMRRTSRQSFGYRLHARLCRRGPWPAP